jgi:ATP-dependent protease ClpP protease subunit
MAAILTRHNQKTLATIHGRALSAGLVLAVACNHRCAVPHAEFLFHGADKRHHESDDQRRAEWFAERTARPAEFWLEKVAQGDYTFGSDEALEIGVIDEIGE